jgi:hypothetical protein
MERTMTRRVGISHQRHQQGAAALAVTMVLLFCMTLVMFYVNRGLLFEQRTSANQYRSTRAFEVAEAGIEWATAMLNNQSRITPACVPNVGGANSFRVRYTDGAAAGFDFNPPANARAGCRFVGGGLVCDCPAPGTDPNPDPGSSNPAFVVQLEGVDAQSIRLTSWGCINQTATCLPGVTGTGDATARVEVMLKARAALRAVPPLPLTVGGDADIGASPIVNTDAASNGWLVNAGGDIDSTLTALQTLPGTPVENALVKNDGALDALAIDTTGAALFQAYFGASLELFQSAATTRVISGASDAARGANLHAAYAEGHRMFFIDGDLDVAAGTLGSATDPVIIVSSSDMSINNGVTIFGIVFSADQSWAGTASVVRGAVLAAGQYVSNGTRIEYTYSDYLPAVFDSLRFDANGLPTNDVALRNAVLVRVPGSWRDFE